MKITIIILALLNGGWMLFDGVYVVLRGKYFGPDVPGPWQAVPKALGLDPFSLGPLFIALGLAWLASALGYALLPERTFWPIMAVAVLSLWYVPIGAVISALVVGLVLWGRWQHGAG